MHFKGLRFHDELNRSQSASRRSTSFLHRNRRGPRSGDRAKGEVVVSTSEGAIVVAGGHFILLRYGPQGTVLSSYVSAEPDCGVSRVRGSVGLCLLLNRQGN
jgi:hypothetical protein